MSTRVEGGDAPPIWQLELLGGLRARRLDVPDAGALERFRTQKTASLLGFLALRRGAHRRETLGELFWPESEPESARNSLRVALSALRGLLEVPGVPEGAILQISRDTVALGHVVETDVALFARALQEARQASDADARRDALHSALSLYRGPLLRGYGAEWMMGDEARLEEQFLAAFAALMALLEAEGDSQSAFKVARRAVAAAPAREEPIAALLQLGAHHGQSAQVAREWDAWLKRAVRDGVSVSQATLELARATRQVPVSNLSEHLSDHLADSRKRFGGAGAEPASRPAPPSLRVSGSLPAQWTNFFGRSRDIETLQEWLESPTQLVTLTGPGGGGKTRLALEVARRLSQGQNASLTRVEWLSLAHLPHAHLLPGAILDAFQVPRGDASLSTLVAALHFLKPEANASGEVQAPRLLLILDNFEHLCDEGVPLLLDLLRGVPHLVCLVTSRRRLGLAGEREWPLQPLETPFFEATTAPWNVESEPIARASKRFEALSAWPSVQLFLDRAQLARPGFSLTEANLEAVARLCAYLDGLPLALELAAARVALFSPAQILSGVNRHMELAPRSGEAVNTPLDWQNHDRTAPERHRSLRAAITWSQHQLPRQMAQFWSRLSTFRGGWTLEAAAFVCEEGDAAPLVLALRDVSLLSLDTRGETPRGHQLEALREFASEGLTPEERHHIAARHAEYFLAWAEGVRPHLEGPRTSHFLERLETERDNLRAAYCWLIQHDVEGALRLGVALYWSWELRGRVEEGREALRITLEATCRTFGDVESLAGPDDRRRLHLIADIQVGAGKLATVASDMAAARGHLEAALRLFRTLRDDEGSADCLYSLGYMHLKSGDLEQARALCDESVAIYRRCHNIHSLCDALYNRGLVALVEGDFEAVRALNNERLAIHRGAGERRGVAISLESLGLAALFSNEFEAAHAYFTESNTIFEDIGEWFSVIRTLWGLGHVARASGQSGQAHRTFLRALELARDSRTLWTLPYLLEGVAYLITDVTCAANRAHQGLAPRGARLLGAASLLRETQEEPLLNPMFRQKFEAAVGTLRDLLGQAHFESQWQLGRSLSPDAMIEFALATEIKAD